MALRKKFPKLWAVKCDSNHFDWPIFMDYFRKEAAKGIEYPGTWGGTVADTYYGKTGGIAYNGYDGGVEKINLATDVVILTTEEAIRLIKAEQKPEAQTEEFVLPSKWAIKGKNKEEGDIITKFVVERLKTPHWEGNNFGHTLYLEVEEGGYSRGSFKTELPKLTFAQFKKHVLENPLFKTKQEQKEEMVKIEKSVNQVMSRTLFRKIKATVSPGCSWQGRLAEIAKRSAEDDNISITPEEVRDI